MLHYKACFIYILFIHLTLIGYLMPPSPSGLIWREPQKLFKEFLVDDRICSFMKAEEP